jgi:LysR family hydrogen peroxide-inducible transcriptional activator
MPIIGKGLTAVELRQLRYALAVAESGSFTRAAEMVHVSQPSLSQQVRLLEDELGVLLFARGPRGTTVTPAGEIVIRQARMVLSQLDDMTRELADLAALQAGSLTIGTLPITGGHVLPPAVAEFRERYPKVSLHLVEERTVGLVAATLNGTTDMSLLTLPIPDDGLDFEPLFTEELWLAVPPGHRLAGRETVALAEAASEPFVLMKKGNGFRTVVEAACNAAEFTPECAFETDSIETAKSLVGAGLGVTLVPAMVAGSTGLASGARPEFIRLAPAPTRTVVLAWRQDRYLSRAALEFRQILREKIQGARR